MFYFNRTYKVGRCSAHRASFKIFLSVMQNEAMRLFFKIHLQSFTSSQF